jgi:hypothetical protein
MTSCAVMRWWRKALAVIMIISQLFIYIKFRAKLLNFYFLNGEPNFQIIGVGSNINIFKE